VALLSVTSVAADAGVFALYIITGFSSFASFAGPASLVFLARFDFF